MTSKTLGKKETLDHCLQMDRQKKDKIKQTKIDNENRVERQMHSRSTAETKGYSSKYSDNYEQIDWSK